jgi:hypothetical protein
MATVNYKERQYQESIQLKQQQEVGQKQFLEVLVSKPISNYFN